MTSLIRSLLVVAALLLMAATGVAQPAGGGPGPAPDPWVVSGNMISYGGCITIPVSVTGGCKGNGTINVAALYINGTELVPSNTLAPGTTLISPSTSGGVLYDNGGVLGDSKTLPSGLSATNLTLVTPILGTPQSGNLTNATGYPFSALASTPTTLAGYGITNGATNGANSNITSLTGLTTPLAGSEGGTGLTAFSRTGNTTSFASVSTSTPLAVGDCVTVDSNYNLESSGAACGSGGGGSGTVNSGTINQLAYYGSSGTAVSGLTTGNNGVLVTSNSGVPSISTTLPSGLSATNLTLVTPALGTPASGNLANTTGYPAATTSSLGTVSTDGATIANSGGAISCRTATSALLGCADFGTGLTISGGAVTPTFGTATGQVAEGGVITAAGPIGSATAVPVITYNAAGQLTTVTTAALGTAAADNTGTTGGTIPLNNGGFTQSGTVNFTGTFEVAGYTETWPSAAANVAALNIQDQSLSGGANLTSYSVSTGSFTADCGKGPAQYVSNAGAFTITAPTNDGECVLQIENGSGAGAVTWSGFSEGANTGDPLDQTSGHYFQVSIARVHGEAHYLISALQ